jgi:hypothetical protein
MTGNPWPNGHDIILQGRHLLQANGQYQGILDKYHQSQVMILSSETDMTRVGKGLAIAFCTHTALHRS